MNFVAFDFETSNPDLSSICQVGLAVFKDGECVDTWGTLVNPLDYFHWRNVKVHGIIESKVKEAPPFSAIADDLFSRLETGIVVSHSRFDIASLSAACGKMNRLPPELRWVDSCQVARFVWQHFRDDGYGLSRLAQRLGIQFSHHDAVEDARAAGLVLCRALKDSGRRVEEFVEQTSIAPTSTPRVRRYRPSDKDSVKQNGNAEGKLFGEVVVFTGALSIPRKEAALRASQAGCAVDNAVTKRTTLLVVGDQDIRLLAGKKISSKQARAEELIESGQCIRILQESDFETLIEGVLEETSFGVDLIQRDIEEPFRPHMTIPELFEGPDKGLISAWEEGRKMERRGEPESEKAKRGELPPLCWAGGLSEEVKGQKFGTLNYLAMWQGLRGESLFIVRSRARRITCSLFNTTITFVDDYVQRMKKVAESGEAETEE